MQDDSSSSVCTTVEFVLCIVLIMYSMISVAGVMGYDAMKRLPAAIAPSAAASFPKRYTRSDFSGAVRRPTEWPCIASTAQS